MGSAESIPSSVYDNARLRSNEIENKLRKDRIQAANEVDVLVLNTGASNLVKQMKIIHDGDTTSGRDNYKKEVYSITIQSMRIVLESLPELDISLSLDNNVHRNKILSLSPYFAVNSLSPDVANSILTLWRDPSVKEASYRLTELRLENNAAYYFNAIDRIASPEYVPTDQDIHRLPQKREMTETTFQVEELTYRLFECNDVLSERRKWIHHFEKVKAVMFLANISEYDKTLSEDDGVNALQESLILFDSICNSKWFVQTPIILILNEIDVFAEKLARAPLGDYFPDYQGGDNYDAAREYLLHRFVSLNQNTAKRQIHAYYTSPSDTQQMKFFLSAFQDIRLQLYLRSKRLL